MSLAIGVDVGGTKVAAGVVDPEGKIVEKVKRLTPAASPAATEQVIVEVVTELRDRYPVDCGRHRRGRLRGRDPVHGAVRAQPGLA